MVTRRRRKQLNRKGRRNERRELKSLVTERSKRPAKPRPEEKSPVIKLVKGCKGLLSINEFLEPYCLEGTYSLLEQATGAELLLFGVPTLEGLIEVAETGLVLNFEGHRLNSTYTGSHARAYISGNNGEPVKGIVTYELNSQAN